MTVRLFFEAIIKLMAGIVLIGLMLFLPAGTLDFFCGWLFMGILFLPMLVAGIVMMIKNPELLKKRLRAKEKQKEQGLIVKLSGLMFAFGFVVSGLGVRFRWYTLPVTVSIIASVVLVFSYILYAEVLRENVYLSRIIEVNENQKVIDTGLYGIVRHPMYSITIIMFLSMPIVLGSVFSFVVFLSYPFLIVGRIKKEEEFLEQELVGYSEYKKKVKYRLIPFVW